MGEMMGKLGVRRDDTVMVITGRDSGKTGRVLRVLPYRRMVLVEGLHLVKKAVRPNPAKGQQGGLVQKESPLAVSNVMLMCMKCNRPTRAGRRRLEGGKSARFCKRCGEIIGKA